MSLAAGILLILLGCGSLMLVVNAVRPATRWWLLMPSWMLAFLVNELAWHLLLVLALPAGALVALGALDGLPGIVGGALMGLALLGTLWLALRGSRTRVQVRSSFRDLEVAEEAPRYPTSEVILPWRAFRRRGVRLTRGVQYAEHGGRRLRLDLYEPPGDREPGRLRPAIVQVHGGGWVIGTRAEQGVPLLSHLARNGWVGLSIDYRLSPHATMPEHVMDVKRAISWARESSQSLGIDPGRICITGGSAGGHLAALAALTAEDESLQPGFESHDTSVAAAVPFYGVYDLLDESHIYPDAVHRLILEPLVFKARREDDPDAYRRASPVERIHEGAPPFMIIHGDADSLVPVADAREFARRLRSVSGEPVVYLEMRGAQHAFDMLPSPRTARVIEGIERFLGAMVLAGPEGEGELRSELTNVRSETAPSSHSPD